MNERIFTFYASKLHWWGYIVIGLISLAGGLTLLYYLEDLNLISDSLTAKGLFVAIYFLFFYLLSVRKVEININADGKILFYEGKRLVYQSDLNKISYMIQSSDIRSNSNSYKSAGSNTFVFPDKTIYYSKINLFKKGSTPYEIFTYVDDRLNLVKRNHVTKLGISKYLKTYWNLGGNYE